MDWLFPLGVLALVGSPLLVAVWFIRKLRIGEGQASTPRPQGWLNQPPPTGLQWITRTLYIAALLAGMVLAIFRDEAANYPTQSGILLGVVVLGLIGAAVHRVRYGSWR